MPDRTKGQTLALMIVGGVVSSLCSAVVFGLLAKAKEADARQPLPGPIVPGHGTV
jgi:H+/Cl- antiporter ClcA